MVYKHDRDDIPLFPTKNPLVNPIRGLELGVSGSRSASEVYMRTGR